VTLGADLIERTFAPGLLAHFDGLVGVTSATLDRTELVVTHHTTASLLSATDGQVIGRVHHAGKLIIKKAIRRGLDFWVAVSESTPSQVLTAESRTMVAHVIAGTRRLEMLPDGRLVTASGGPGLDIEGPLGALEELTTEQYADLAVAGFHIAALAKLSRRIHVWDATGPPLLLADCPPVEANAVSMVDGPDGAAVILAGTDSVEAIDLECRLTGSWTVPGIVSTRVTTAWRGSQRLVAAGTRSGEVLVWRWDGTLVARVLQHVESVSSLSVDTDHRWLVSGAWDGRVRFLDLDVLDQPASHLATAVRSGWGRR
jgi:hypothetical protein